MRLTFIIAFLIGIGLFGLSMTMPFYNDGLTQEDLWSLDEHEYYKKAAELGTNKILFMDMGAGICIASVLVLMFLLITKSRTISDLKKIKTMRKWPLFISANLIWLLLIPGTYWYYTFRGIRGDYPPFADSIGIPIFTTVPLLLVLMVPLNLFLVMTIASAHLPARLFCIADKYLFKEVLIEIFFGLLLILNIICFVSFVIDGDHFAIPVNMFFFLVLLTLRAGQIDKGKNLEKTPAYNTGQLRQPDSTS
jgi:hypothetical protein